MAKGIFDLVLPLYALILLGLLVKREGLITEEGVGVLNNVAFYLSLPALIVRSLSEFPLSFPPNLILGFYLSVLLLTAIAWMGAKPLKRSKRGVFIQGSFKGNLGFMGLPILFASLGSEAVAKASLLLALYLPYDVLSSISLLTHYGSGNADLRDVVKRVLSNPLLLATAVGLAISLTPLEIPEAVFKILDLLKGMALPLALLIIGCSLSLDKMGSDLGMAALSSLLKLLLLPLVGYFLFRYVFPVPSADMKLGMLLMGMPTAVNTILFARELSSEESLAASIVLLSTLLSLPTISLLLFLFQTQAF